MEALLVAVVAPARALGRGVGKGASGPRKTFQVRAWRDLRAAWSALDAEARSRVRQVLPGDGVGGAGSGSAHRADDDLGA